MVVASCLSLWQHSERNCERAPNYGQEGNGMKVRDLCDVVARATGHEFGHVQLHARRLREAGYLPEGKRGQAGPPVEPQHAADLLIGLLATSVASYAPEQVGRYNNAREALSEAVSQVNRANKIARIHLKRGNRAVYFEWWDEREISEIPPPPEVYSDTSHELFNVTTLGAYVDFHTDRATLAPFEERVTLRGDVIVRVAEALAADVETDGRRRQSRTAAV